MKCQFCNTEDAIKMHLGKFACSACAESKGLNTGLSAIIREAYKNGVFSESLGYR